MYLLCLSRHQETRNGRPWEGFFLIVRFITEEQVRKHNYHIIFLSIVVIRLISSFFPVHQYSSSSFKIVLPINSHTKKTLSGIKLVAKSKKIEDRIVISICLELKIIFCIDIWVNVLFPTKISRIHRSTRTNRSGG